MNDVSSAIMDAAVDGIIVIDSNGVVVSFNSDAEKLFQYLRGEVVGKNVSMLMPDRYGEHHDEYIANYVRFGNAKIIGFGRDVEGLRKDGSRFPMHLSVGESIESGSRQFIGICHDLTDYKEALRRLALAEQRYKDVIQSQSELICRLDDDLKVTFANVSFTKAMGLQHSDVIGMPMYELVAEEGPVFRDTLRELFREHFHIKEITLKILMQGNHEPALVDWTFRRLPNSSDYGVEIQGFGVDVSEKEAAIERAEYLKTHDHLTGFLNKIGLVEYLGLLQPATSETCAILSVDCENFGLINQKFGYDFGDAILCEAASRIRRLAGEEFTICRPGGDDFLLFKRSVAPDAAERLALELTQSLESPYEIKGETLTLGGFVGLAFYPKDSESLVRLPELAEAAAKDAERRKEPIAYFDESYHAALRRKLEIEQGLKAAIERGEIEVYLQPKFKITEKRICEFEALARWTDPKLGFVSPGEFVPIAEQSVLGQTLDRYVIKFVVTLLSSNLDTERDLCPIAVNITAEHFSNPGLANFIIDLMEGAGVPPWYLSLEVTEGVLMKMAPDVSNNLSTLRAYGVSVAIDDFGTGYSSLSYLKQIPADELKIDKSFIDGILTPEGAALVEAIISVARAFNLRVTAEGVETDEQLESLASMGCDVGQGYWFARPAPALRALELREGLEASADV